MFKRGKVRGSRRPIRRFDDAAVAVVNTTTRWTAPAHQDILDAIRIFSDAMTAAARCLPHSTVRWCSGSGVVEYKSFIVSAFEREPGKWRASVERANGKALIRMASANQKALNRFVTGVDAMAAESALRMAMAAIDANAFSRKLHRAENT